MSSEVFDVVSPYLHRIKRSGGPNIIAICPFHEDPQSSTPSFSLNTDNGLWQCFGCGRTGNLRKLLLAMKVPRSRVDAIVGPVQERAKVIQKENKLAWKGRFRRKGTFNGDYLLPEGILGIYDYAPVRLLKEGFEASTLQNFGIGYDRRLKRITFPLRDMYGNLVGISGRTIKNIDPRYKVYEGGYVGRDGEWVVGDFGPEFDDVYRNFHVDSKKYLWNADRAWKYLKHAPRGTPLIIAEGFKACMWIEQMGWPNTVAIMGTSISMAQVDVLNHIADGPPILMLDNDGPGIIGRWKVGQWLRKSRRVVLVCSLPKGIDAPDDASQEQLQESIENPKRYEKWLKEEWRTHCLENGVHVDRPLDVHPVAGAVGDESEIGRGFTPSRRRESRASRS